MLKCMVQEEREKRLEALFDAGFEDVNDNAQHFSREAPEEGAAGLAGRRTQETVTAADSIIDALDLAEVESARIAQHQVLFITNAIIGAVLSLNTPSIPPPR